MSTRHPVSLALRGVVATLNRQQILRDITLEVLPGEMCVVLGASDCGKSTLLRVIAGLDPLVDGEIRVDDRDIRRLKARQRGMALLLQSFPLWPHRTIADNVGFAARVAGLDRGHTHERVEQLLAWVGLRDFMHHLPTQLAADQQQRVALARTIAADARLYLFDEPFAAQPAPLRKRLARLLRRRLQQTSATSVLATQDADTAFAIADRIALIHNGEIRQIGTPAQLYDAPVDRHAATFLGDANLIDGEIELVGDQAMFRGANGIVIPLFDHAIVRPRTCSAMFRPHDLRVITDHQAPIGDEIRLAGRVEEMEFRGDTLRFRVDLSGNTAWLDVRRDGSQIPPNVGDRLMLGLDPTCIRILER